MITQDRLQASLQSHFSNQQQPQPQQKQGSWADWLPLIGGVAGSFVPGLGTILGGALGAGLGTIGKQTIEKTPFNPGEVALESGFAGLGGLGGKLLSGLLGKVAPKIAGGAAEAGSEGGLLQKGGRKLISGITNPKVNEDLPYAETLKKDILSKAQNYSLKGPATAQAGQIDSLYNDLGSQVNNLVKDSNFSLNKKDLNNLITKYVNDQGQYFVPGDPANLKTLNNEINLLTKGNKPTSLSDVIDNIGRLDKQTKAVYGNTNPGIRVGIKKDVRDALDNILQSHPEIDPQIKQLRLQQSDLYKIKPGIADSAKKGINIPFFGKVGGPVNTAVQSGQSLVGNMLSSLPQMTRAGQAGVQGGIQLGLEGLKNQVGQPSTSDSLSNYSSTPEMTNTKSPTGGLTSEAKAAILLTDLQKTGGKNIPELSTILSLLSPQVKPLTAQQQTNASNANSGLRAVDTIEQELSNNPTVLLQAAIPGAPGARVFDTARKEAADVLTRLRTGAALNEEEQKFYSSQLPQLGDSGRTIQYKLSLFRDLFRRLANQQGAGVDSGGLGNLLQ